jgi:hypothetical protein
MMDEQLTTPAAVELAGGGGREDEDCYDVATTTAGRTTEPPPLTHDDNRGFLQMLRDNKERYGDDCTEQINYSNMHASINL